jgi:hypothetical protein
MHVELLLFLCLHVQSTTLCSLGTTIGNGNCGLFTVIVVARRIRRSSLCSLCTTIRNGNCGLFTVIIVARSIRRSFIVIVTLFLVVARSTLLFLTLLFLTLQISVSPQQAELLAVLRTVAVKILLVSSPELLGGAACSMKHTWYCIYM